jgi:uroporphyrin-III C-methyltransferase
VVVVEHASLPNERRLGTTLAGLAQAVAALDGPALLIIGEVAALADLADRHSMEAADDQAPLGVRR